MESDGGGIVVAVAVPTTPRKLSSQRSTVHNSVVVNELADYLNSVTVVNKNNNPTSPRPVSSITLGDVLNGVKKPTSPKNVVVRNLLEILRNDETLNATGGAGSPNSKNSWKSFKEKLKRKTSRKWTSSMPVPQSDVLPMSSRSGRDLMSSSRNSLRNSLRNPSMRRSDSVAADEASMMEVDGSGSPRSGGSFRLSAALAAEREETRRRLSRELDEDGKVNDNKHDDHEVHSNGSGKEDGEGDEEDDDEGPNFGAPTNQPVKMSLMDLLEETDRQAGIDGPTYRLDDDEEEDYEDEDEDEEEEAVEQDEQLGKGEFCCSVCMVKHKGSAYTPCGHTFCKLCSKELFVQKGNCPLCNNFILEILEIF